jgi:mRNA interferase MazF
MKRGQVYYADLGEGIGSEQGGLRPVLIIQNDIGNKHSTTTIIAPLTTQVKTKLPTHCNVMLPNGRKSIVLLEQIRIIDKKRIQGKPIGQLRNMGNIDNAIRASLGLAGSQD